MQLRDFQGCLFRMGGNHQLASGGQKQLRSEQGMEFAYFFLHLRSCLAQIIVHWRCLQGWCQGLGEPLHPHLSPSLLIAWPAPGWHRPAQPQTSHPVLMVLVHKTFTCCFSAGLLEPKCCEVPHGPCTTPPVPPSSTAARSSTASLPCGGSVAQLSHRDRDGWSQVTFMVCAAAHEAPLRPQQCWQELPVPGLP